MREPVCVGVCVGGWVGVSAGECVRARALQALRVCCRTLDESTRYALGARAARTAVARGVLFVFVVTCVMASRFGAVRGWLVTVQYILRSTLKKLTICFVRVCPVLG